MGKIFKFLGMSVAVATDNMLNIERRVPFAADVTYVTAQVLCFTYLFDNTTQTKNYTVSCAFAADVTCVTAHKCCASCICTTMHICITVPLSNRACTAGHLVAVLLCGQCCHSA